MAAPAARINVRRGLFCSNTTNPAFTRDPVGAKASHDMSPKNVRRTFMLLMFLGGPSVGWLINGPRGLMFGLALSVLAVGWFLLEERRVV